MEQWRSELYHFGILGQKWGVRRYQNSDGTLTEAGKKRYYDENRSSLTENDNANHLINNLYLYNLETESLLSQREEVLENAGASVIKSGAFKRDTIAKIRERCDNIGVESPGKRFDKVRHDVIYEALMRSPGVSQINDSISDIKRDRQKAIQAYAEDVAKHLRYKPSKALVEEGADMVRQILNETDPELVSTRGASDYLEREDRWTDYHSDTAEKLVNQCDITFDDIMYDSYSDLEKKYGKR